MQKTYDPQAIEERWYTFWEEQGYFKPNDNDQPYCIMIPPPNVTGTLHMGHAFQHTLMDALIRFQRMQGKSTLWQPGTDHAGIATQMVVERQLKQQGESRLDLGREAFVERVWQWKAQSGDTITRQMRRIGDSPDWSRERFTMDEGLSKAVTEVFVRLHEEGLIYRGKRLVNWDPVLKTAISDLEVISEEENGHLWHMRYPITGSNDYLIVATTRPETMLGDTAVAVHPEDSRYQNLIGKTVELPLANRQIPIIADDYVDPEFGSGCVKITPAHDFNDYAIGQRHKLAMINVFTDDARINDSAPEAYRGLDRYDARKKIVADLQSAELLEKIVDHKLMVPRGDRTQVVIEPYLTDQWYVKADVLAKPSIEAVETGKIRFIPENWSKTYFNWMRNIEDWCISRQLWWGHRIPAWYDEEGNIYVGRNENDIRTQHGLPNELTLKQDEDVLDTWFSSALWPFSTLGWPEADDKKVAAALQKFYPSSVLVTGFDIIFFWVARMIMMGLKFMDDVPFKEVYITGLIRDERGQKMSKSKGNILDPLDLMDGITLDDLIAKRTTGLMQPEMADKIAQDTRTQFPQGMPGYGADALRFTLASLASTGRDIRFDIQRMQGYRNFCNKLWNASRYVVMNTEKADPDSKPEAGSFNTIDHWIMSLQQQLIENVTRYFEEYRFDLAAQAIYDFTWNEYCDWYLELSKPILLSDTILEKHKHATQYTLLNVLENLLRIAHPIIPYITEALWQQLAPAAKQGDTSIMVQTYPVLQNDMINTSAIREIDWIKAFVIGVRRIRSERDIAPGKKVSVFLQNGDDNDKIYLDNNIEYLMTLAKLKSIEWLGSEEETSETAIALVGELKILVPLTDIIDKTAELERLEKNIQALLKNQDRLTQKLNNDNFTSKAPKAIVQKEKDKLADINHQLTNLQQQADTIRALPE